MLPRDMSDVEVVFGDVPRDLEHVGAAGVLWQANPTQFLLDAPGVARYFVERGERLTVEEDAGCPRADVARFARASPLAALAWQRGLLALHAAVAVDGDGAVLLAGDSSGGKSSLLAALLARGWKMLADDVAIVRVAPDGTPEVLPVSADLALWPDVLRWLGPQLRPQQTPEAPDALDGEEARRVVLTVGDGFVDEPRPLRGICWLGASHRQDVEIADLPGLDRFQAIATLACNSRIAAATCDRPAFLRNAEAVAHAVRVRQVRRPRGRWTIAALADVVDEARW
jgi:hypothetical protein